MAGISACLEQIVQPPHLLGRLDIHGVLRANLLNSIAGDEAEVPHLFVQVAQAELDDLVGIEIVEAKPCEIGNEDVARQIAVRQCVKVVGSLRKGPVEVLAFAFVLDQ